MNPIFLAEGPFKDTEGHLGINKRRKSPRLTDMIRQRASGVWGGLVCRTETGKLTTSPEGSVQPLVNEGSGRG